LLKSIFRAAAPSRLRGSRHLNSIAMVEASPVSELVQALRTDMRAKLLDCLDEMPGRKVLVMDPSIVRPLDSIVTPQDLKDHSEQRFILTEHAVSVSCSQMIFLMSCCRAELIDRIAKQIVADKAARKDRMYVVVFLARKAEQCMEMLNRRGISANVKVRECAIHFFPFDGDILSMEAPGVFNEFHVMGDPSGAFYLAKALMFLQAKFGTIPTVHAIGAAGKTVVDIMLRLRKDEQMSDALKDPKPSQEFSPPGVPSMAPHGSQPPQHREGTQQQPHEQQQSGTELGPGIDEVIILDRRVDLFSVLCSPFTYQALIHEALGIHHGVVDVSSAAWAQERTRGQAHPILRNGEVFLSHDKTYFPDIRDLHINSLGPLLRGEAETIRTTYSERDNVTSSGEMADYITRFKTAQAKHPLIEVHTNLAQDLQNKIQSEDYRQHLKLEDDITAQSSQSPLESIEDWIDDQKPFHEVMRLLFLYSLVNNGIKAKQYDQIKRGIIQSYGDEHELTLSNMERVGILRKQESKSVWSSTKTQFNLFPVDADPSRDMSYAYSGYAPLSARLVEMMKKSPTGWRACQDALNLLYGPYLEFQQQLDVSEATHANAAEQAMAQGRPSVTLVCFVGGVTYGEIAAIRRLSEMEEGRRRFLVLTTEMLSARKLLDSVSCETVVNQVPPEEPRVGQRPEERRRGFCFWPGGR